MYNDKYMMSALSHTDTTQQSFQRSMLSCVAMCCSVLRVWQWGSVWHSLRHIPLNFQFVATYAAPTLRAGHTH